MGLEMIDESAIDDSQEQLWPMGAVTRRTGLGEHTLRAWERRFGFPTPLRLPSGHRRYDSEQVKRLLMVAKALEAGYRAGDVVPLDMSELEKLLRSAGVFESFVASGSPEDIEELIFDACRRFDREGLAALLRREAALLGLPRFLRDRVSPLLTQIGEMWSRGDFAIRHEHFFSEVLEDQLRALRAPLHDVAKGRPVAIASLPNEFHGLGLQLAALSIVASGRAVRILGPHLPVDEIVQSAIALDASAVGISVSVFADPDETGREIAELRELLPESIQVWVGGAGAPSLSGLPSEGVEITSTLDELDSALLRLSD
jgi:DNA-binding transcriptional MerR regulator/methylmalonyl-CoA mutase cobalamin-binding subunit